MRTIAAALLLCLSAGLEMQAGTDAKLGTPVSNGDAITVPELLKQPESFGAKPVIVEGIVDKACSTKGCWMVVADKKGAPGVRVTFKDYGFFIPLTAAGMKVRAEGIVGVKTLAKSHVDHLEDEGAEFKRKVDGSAVEVSFVATGVELTK